MEKRQANRAPNTRNYSGGTTHIPVSVIYPDARPNGQCNHICHISSHLWHYANSCTGDHDHDNDNDVIKKTRINSNLIYYIVIKSHSAIATLLSPCHGRICLTLTHFGLVDYSFIGCAHPDCVRWWCVCVCAGRSATFDATPPKLVFAPANRTKKNYIFLRSGIHFN